MRGKYLKVFRLVFSLFFNHNLPKLVANQTDCFADAPKSDTFYAPQFRRYAARTRHVVACGGTGGAASRADRRYSIRASRDANAVVG
jgi:hypothetical protein